MNTPSVKMVLESQNLADGILFGSERLTEDDLTYNYYAKDYQGNVKDGSEYNHPNNDKYQPQTLAASSVAAKVIRLTVNQKSDIISLLNTVENIQNALGVHELKSHGIQGVNRENHYLAYQNQITHYTWSKTTAAFKEHFYKAYLTYAAAAKQTHTQLYKKVYNLIHPHK